MNTAKKTPEATDPAVPKAALSTREAARYLNISLPTMYRLLKAGELPYLRIGRILRFRLEDLDRFLESRVIPARTDTD